MAQKPKKLTKSPSSKPKKKAVPEFAKPFYKKRWFAIFALILVFSAIGGGYMLRKGDAAEYVFIRRAPQIANTIDQPGDQDKKSDGITYKLISTGQGTFYSSTTISTFLTKQEATRSSRICAHFKVFDSRGKSNRIKIMQVAANQGGVVRERFLTIAPTTPSGNICFDNPVHVDSTVDVMGDSSGTGATIGVDTIYGKP